MRAREQHHELVQKIRKYDKQAKVELAVIPLGVAGAIYHNTRQLMQDTLGVAGLSQDTLLRNLHIHAVNALTKILRQRRIASGTRTGKCSTAQTAAATARPTANAQQAKPRPQLRPRSFRQKARSVSERRSDKRLPTMAMTWDWEGCRLGMLWGCAGMEQLGGAAAGVLGRSMTFSRGGSGGSVVRNYGGSPARHIGTLKT